MDQQAEAKSQQVGTGGGSDGTARREPAGDVAEPDQGAYSSGTALQRHFKTREVVALLDLSRRQLQYWAKTGLIEPSMRTPGGHHRYTFDDLVALKATKRLIDAGVSVQKIRRSVSALQSLLPQVGRPLSELVLVATGDVVLVFQDDTVFEAISGQEWVFEVAAFEREVSRYCSSVESGGERAGAKLGELVARDATRPDGSEALPAKPGPRGARLREKDWSQTG